MAISGIDHIYQETRSFESMIQFWNALGFAEASAWGDDGHRACRLESGKAAVVLAQAAGEESYRPDTIQRPTVHFSIEAAGVEALSARLVESAHVKLLTPLEPTHWGTHWIRVEDPDGNLYVLEQV